jgi:hypothetical protein
VDRLAATATMNIENLKENDYCLVVVPGNDIEPVAVMQYVRPITNGVELIWLGENPLRWYIDVRMQQQKWRKSWFDLDDKMFYYNNTPKKTLDIPFTNVLSQEQILLENIFFFGFSLMHDKRLPQYVCDIALTKYRQLNLDRISTYELYPPPAPTE